MNAADIFRVGLTGGIGSGKSTVANRFVGLGAALVDTDVIAHRLTAPGGAAIDPIRARFGAAMIAPDGRLDRAAMRAQGKALVRITPERWGPVATGGFPPHLAH